MEAKDLRSLQQIACLIARELAVHPDAEILFLAETAEIADILRDAVCDIGLKRKRTMTWDEMGKRKPPINLYAFPAWQARMIMGRFRTDEFHLVFAYVTSKAMKPTVQSICRRFRKSPSHVYRYGEVPTPMEEPKPEPTAILLDRSSPFQRPASQPTASQPIKPAAKPPRNLRPVPPGPVYTKPRAAGTAAKILGIRTQEDYRALHHLNPRLPEDPSVAYADVWADIGGWTGFLDGNIAKQPDGRSKRWRFWEDQPLIGSPSGSAVESLPTK